MNILLVRRSSLLTWASGAPTRSGYEVLGRSWMYTTRVPRPRALRPRDSVVSQWDVLLALGIAPQPYRSASFISAAAEVHGLPCRPCDQRVCSPGDFRCLSGISAESVAALAERALAVPTG